MVFLGQTFILHQQVKFDGDRFFSKESARFYVNFRSMNAYDSETLFLHEGDRLHVAWKVEKGKADFIISMPEEVPIYRANKCKKGEMADFDVLIPKTGEYRTSISARNAKGWINVNKLDENEM